MRYSASKEVMALLRVWSLEPPEANNVEGRHQIQRRLDPVPPSRSGLRTER